MSSKFPYAVNEFYDKKDVWRKLRTAGMGGIRPNVQANFVLLFLNAPHPNPAPGRSENVYKDYYDEATGLFHFTGRGQEGNQRMAAGNLWLDLAEKRGTKLHLFRQYHEGGLHEYLGEVEVDHTSIEIQPDMNKKNRKVFVFWLRPLSEPEIDDQGAVEREIESKEEKGEGDLSDDELDAEIRRTSEEIAKRGPQKRKRAFRSGEDYVRFKRIVRLMKWRYKNKCQTCGTSHFRTSRGIYSEVHHLRQWAETHDDGRENLVVVCATCHRKLHNAVIEERRALYENLLLKYPEIAYRKPKFMLLRTGKGSVPRNS